MYDYTRKWGEIVRGGRWPPATYPRTLVMTKSSAWADGADAWTWELLLSRRRAGGAPDLTLLADTVHVDGTKLTLTFHASAAQTALLPGRGRSPFFVELKSTIEGPTTTTPGDNGPLSVSYYSHVAGAVWVRDAVGGYA